MARINTNVASLTAQRGLSQSQKLLTDTLQRLSSGLKINRGADDPAGLIASEGLRSEMSGITQAITNSSRASNVIATAEGALSEVASLLLNIKDLTVEAANSGALSREEIAANQLQVDSAVESITRISNTTTFAGLNLLNGSLDYITEGVNEEEQAIRSLQVFRANFGTNDSIPVNVSVVTQAEQAELRYMGEDIEEEVTLEIAGNRGVDVLSFTGGTSVEDIATAINRISDTTGVTAEVLLDGDEEPEGVAFRSAGYGTGSFVSVTPQSGSLETVVDDPEGDPGDTIPATRAVGVDAVATVNGAVTVGDGLDIKVNTTGLDMEMTLEADFEAGESTSFDITGGGSLFQLGPQVTSNQQVNIGIQSVAASKLGDETVGFLNEITTGGGRTLVGGNAREASEIVERAIRQVAVLRGRLGAFEKNTLETNMNSLTVALENVTASESMIRDADFAAETAALTRAQILNQAGTSVLATANATPQSVLSLLQ